MIPFTCPYCRQVLGALPQHAGTVVACPRCKKGMRMPAIFTALPAAANVALPVMTEGASSKRNRLRPKPPPSADGGKRQRERAARLNDGCALAIFVGSLSLLCFMVGAMGGPLGAFTGLVFGAAMPCILFRLRFPSAGYDCLFLLGAFSLFFSFLLTVHSASMSITEWNGYDLIVDRKAESDRLIGVLIGLAWMLASLLLLIFVGLSYKNTRSKKRAEI